MLDLPNHGASGPKLLAARAKYFEDDHLNFWSPVRMAEEAEHQYFMTIANKDEKENAVGSSAL
jgi:hypothetical protein